MLKQKVCKRIAILFLVVVFVFFPLKFKGSFFQYVEAKFPVSDDNKWLDYDNYTVINEDVTWSGNVVYDDIMKPVVIVDGATVTIEKGTHVSLLVLNVFYGRIVAEGTAEDPIIFTKAAPSYSAYPDIDPDFDLACGSDPRGVVSFDDWSFADGNDQSVFSHVKFENMGSYDYWNEEICSGGSAMFNSIKNSIFPKAYAQTEPRLARSNPALEMLNGKLRIEDSAFLNNSYADIVADNTPSENGPNSFFEIVNSNFEGNKQNVALDSWIVRYDENANEYMHNKNIVSLENNWYGSSDGPRQSPDFSTGGEMIKGDYTLLGYSKERFEYSACTDCASNVLFLPGIEASRLYMKKGSDEDQLWEPNFFGNDIEDLAMDENGESDNSVYTKEVIDEVGDIWAGGNIYKSFENKLKELKENDTINGYDMFAYDWRKNVEDVAAGDTAYFPGIMKNALSTTKSLADSSKSKKVTIVAHSNGGLLAKAIMLELRKEGKEDMVDKIVFVASPQMGTPRAITSMLYGHDEGLVSELLSTDSEMRTLAENMPGAYGLLPSEEYLKNIENPLIKFSSEQTRYKAFKDAYGEDISKDEYDQFFNFLLGKDDGREKPDADDIKLENVLNEGLLQQAKDTHERLDAWTPPASMKVYEIAGWGLDTISGIEYKEKKGTVCDSYNAKVPSCTETDSFHEPFYDPIWTVDGDEVVVAPSALMLKEAGNVEKYWVNLYKHNKGVNIDREHKNVLEVDSVRNLISNIITNNSEASLPEYIETSRPDDYENARPRLRMSLYSPLEIHLSVNGKHTGPIIIEENGQQIKTFEEEIPNSYYYQFGDRKYVGIPVGENIHMEMKGYDSGSYTLKLEEVNETAEGEQIIAQKIFSDLPVSSDTKVNLDIPESGLTTLSNLKADYDGDGTDDYEVVVNSDGEMQIIDNVKPKIEILSPEAKEYQNSQTIYFSYDIKDNLSEKGDIAVKTFLDDQQTSDSKIDLAMLHLGSHKIKITATDKANNTQEKEITFSITTSLQALKDNVQKYYDAKLIKSKQQKNMLLVSLEIIEQRLEFLEMIRKNPYISKKAKGIIEKIIREQIENHVEFLIKQINHNSNKYDMRIKGLLVEDLQWLELNAVK